MITAQSTVVSWIRSSYCCGLHTESKEISMRYFVLPDLHGHHFDYLMLLREAWKWAREMRSPLDYVVCLGDYVDGGPDSDLILQSLMHNWAESSQPEWLCL